MNYNRSEFQASYGLSSQLPESDRPEFVFSGRSNVGKSSLINRLCNRKNLARVSATPGKTATINFYRVDTAYFVDLPGYGYAKVSNADRERWDELINSYFEADRSVCLLVQLLDSRHAPSADDLQMLEYLRGLCREVGARTIWLTVNRRNERAIGAYRRAGFREVRAQVTDIGGGYVMDDYVMELETTPQKE